MSTFDGIGTFTVGMVFGFGLASMAAIVGITARFCRRLLAMKSD